MARLLTGARRAAALKFYARTTRLDIPASFLATAPLVGTVEFAEAVAAFQAAHGLVVDGKAGPKETIPVMRRTFAASVRRHDVLIFRGKEFEIPGVRVVNPWSPEGYDFSRYPGHTHGMMVLDAPRALVLHDALARTADACFTTLLTRKDEDGKNLKLGTGLMLSPSGTLYQCVPDLAIVTRHAGGGWNGVAVGLDVIALLDTSYAPNSPLRRPRQPWSPDVGYLDYTPTQIAVLPAVVHGVCDALGVPFRCERQADGRPWYQGKEQKLALHPLTFGGVLGHGQASPVRWDGNLGLAYAFGAAP